MYHLSFDSLQHKELVSNYNSEILFDFPMQISVFGLIGVIIYM